MINNSTWPIIYRKC